MTKHAKNKNNKPRANPAPGRFGPVPSETPSKRWAVKAKDEDNLGLKIGLAFCWPKT
ncbi:hypothetical protein FGRA07_07754 [Fusarium graminearum]|nr:hypothetical protein FGRA07_07754 [Fusarium graminearum]